MHSKTADMAWDDEALFGGEENEEEDGEFVMYALFSCVFGACLISY